MPLSQKETARLLTQIAKALLTAANDLEKLSFVERGQELKGEIERLYADYSTQCAEIDSGGGSREDKWAKWDVAQTEYRAKLNALKG